MTTTGSTMHCYTSVVKLFFLSLLLSFAPPGAHAADLTIRNPLLSIGEDGYLLSADFSINLNARLEEVVAKGVTLYFVVDFELTRARWYWLDEQVASRSQTYQLSYHALTRQYRLSSGALHQSFATLDDALRLLARLRNWQVLERNTVSPGQTYLAAVRMRLDLTQMPKTFQVNALANRDWNLTSEWARWQFSPADVGSSSATVAPAAVPGGGEGK